MSPSIAWLYLWIFRGTPVYVQLVFWGIVVPIYPVFTIGIPFMEPWITIENGVFTNLFITAVIGLALNEAAYMSEIVRAGLLSVDEGQEEAFDGGANLSGNDAYSVTATGTDSASRKAGVLRRRQ